jgi:HupE / UreJ protein
MPRPVPRPRRSRGSRPPRLAPFLLLAAILLTGGVASAHAIGMSQLRLRVNGSLVEGEWEVQLADARLALDLDPQVTGEPGWRNLRDHDAALRAYFVDRVTLSADGVTCPVTPVAAAPDWQADQSLVVLHFAAACASEPVRLSIGCDLLFERDPKHRPYFSVQDARVTQVGVFKADRRAVALELRQFHPVAGFVEFLREGIGHIWSGVDHMLFLLALLLPASLVRVGGGWSLRRGFGPTTREVVKVVTAFTLAHSLTLGLAFFGLVNLRSQWVEVAIALSIFAAAWNNLRPFLPGRGWAMALVFGLVHGLGFAGALRNLALPIHARGLALAAFNIGVEVGQLVIVALVLPLLYAASRWRGYPRLVLGVGSLLVAWLAALWTVERAFGISLI